MNFFASRIILLLGFLLAAGFSSFADSKTDEVDTLFAKWDSTISPGCSIAVIRDGEIIYKRGYGMANLDYGIALTPQSIFRIASVSKQFTAMCMNLLAEEGKLSLDDDIRKYVPEIPDYGSPITIRHLIHHTSGLRDYTQLQQMARRGENYNNKELLRLLSRQKRLMFKTGEKEQYCNSGYFLLSVIVERASGQSIREYAQEHIFEPLGMKNTHYHDDHTEIVPHRAYGYTPRKEGGFREDMTILDIVGDGGIFTNLEDLFLWDQNFSNNKLGKGGPGLIKAMHIRGKLNSGKEINYAGGLVLGTYRGLKTVSHGGGWVGFRSFMLRFPEQRFTAIVLGNCGDINPGRLAHQIANIYLGDEFTEEKKEDQKQQQAPQPYGASKTAENQELLLVDQMKEYAGMYYSDEIECAYTIVIQEDRLYAGAHYQPELALEYMGDDRFKSPAGMIEFKRGDDGRIMRLEYLTIQFERIKD